MYESLEERNEVVNVERNINTVQDKLKEIHSMIRELVSKDMNVEAIGDLVEKELQGMDKSIEEAAARIEVIIFSYSTFNFCYKMTEILGNAFTIKNIGLWYKIGSKREDLRCLYKFDEGN